jgi:hypothetical protein
MNHPTLLENAFTLYFESLVWSSQLDFFAGENNLDKNGPRIVSYIEGGELGEEDPPTSGNRWFEIVCELRTPFFKLTAAQIAANVPQPLVQHQANEDMLQSAITNINICALLETAQSGLSIFGITQRTPMREQQDNGWMSGWKVRGLSAPSTIA